MVKSVSIIKYTARNVMYWMMMFLCVSGGFVFIYKVLINPRTIKSMMDVMIPLEIALYCGILAIMCEFRPRKTQAQRDSDDKTLNNGLNNIILITLMNVVLLIIAIVSRDFK
jgi:hypothetical protein